MRQIIVYTLLFFTFLIPVANAEETEQFAVVMKLEQGPVGVVFEIVGGDAESLHKAINRIKGYMKKIKLRFPDSKFVVVSHGMEQFSLLKEKEDDHPELHKQVQSLVKEDQTPLQVCGSFAEMMGVEDKEFLSIVNVVASGPAQIEFYKYKGYRLVEMDLEFVDD